MNKDKIKQLIAEGYEPLVFLQGNKDYSKMILKTRLQKENCNIVYPVYYNHIKTILKKYQLEFIDTYNKVKLLRFSDIVELNIKSKNNTINKNDMKLLVMYRAIKNMDYLEQK
jgi:hypothetical protein